ncbi:MAG: OmpH family outer membrane protein [Flavobacteriia bacterium]|nr:OmpH family outer membrane protein [Flavobacteriia bacterium]
MKKLFLVAIAAIFTISTAVAQQKIGHVNSDSLLNAMPSKKAADDELQALNQNGIKELQEMNADLEKAYVEYEKIKPTLTPLRQQMAERAIQEKEQRLRERQQTLQEELQAINNELMQPILKRIEQAVAIVADRKKLNYVIDVTATLYHKTGINLTKEVMVELLKLDAEAMKPVTPPSVEMPK